MLNDQQQAIVKEIVDKELTKLDAALPAIKLKALKATFSIQDYFEILDELKEHKIEDIVKTVGEMLSHPTPENPTQSNITFHPAAFLHYDFVMYKFPDQVIKKYSRGLFNLISHNTVGSEITQAEIRQFIEEMITNKILTLEPAYQKIKPNLKKRKREIEITTENFLDQPMDAQLDHLKINSASYSLCDESNFRYYQLFLTHFKKTCHTIEETNKLLHEIHGRFIAKWEEAKNIIGAHNAKDLTLAHFFETSLGKFPSYLESENANFYTYKTLVSYAIILWHHFGLLSYLQSDFLYVALILASKNQSDSLQVLLTKNAANIPSEYRNFLFASALENLIIEPTTIKVFLESIAIDTGYMTNQLEKYLSDPFFKLEVCLELLRFPGFKTIFSIQLATLAYKKAIGLNSFEMQTLVLMHSPVDFVARLNLNVTIFSSLVKRKNYQAAKKMVTMYYPGILSKMDLINATALSEGQLEFADFEPQRGIVPDIPLHALQNHVAATPSLDALALPTSSTSCSSSSSRPSLG